LLAPFIGSFLGVIVARAETPRAIVLGRSACSSCGAQLAALDLIPLASWVYLRGRCRVCSVPIGLLHPIVELSAIGIALWAASLFSDGWLWVSCLFGWALLALAATDWKYFVLPDFLTIPLIAAGLAVDGMSDAQTLLSGAIGAIAGYGFVILVRYVYRRLRGREGMGLGDAKLLAASGTWVSWSGLPTVILLGALAGLGLVLLERMRGTTISLTQRVPFGTFLCIGTWIVWLYGPLAAA
jgi:leader peptidase (prepilin peptidase)/N-methyltransferase